jgi:hypothetical protein
MSTFIGRARFAMVGVTRVLSLYGKYNCSHVQLCMQPMQPLKMRTSPPTHQLSLGLLIVSSPWTANLTLLQRTRRCTWIVAGLLCQAATVTAAGKQRVFFSRWCSSSCFLISPVSRSVSGGSVSKKNSSLNSRVPPHYRCVSLQ